MQVLQIIYYFNLSFFYLTYDATFALLTKDPPCFFPYALRECVPNTEQTYNCLVHPMSREQYLKCDLHSFFRINFRSTSLLMLYPPFIETLINRSEISNHLEILFQMSSIQSVYDIDLRPFNRIQSSINLTLYTYPMSRPAQIIFKTYTWSAKNFYQVSLSPTLWGIQSNWQPTHKNNSMKSNDNQCFQITIQDSNHTDTVDYEMDRTCPSDQCLINKNNTRLCLGSTSCLYMADNTFLCRIDQLRSSDRFNLNTTFLYKDLVIITSDTQKQTLHTFSEYLLNSCIAERLVIIVIHGRLAIPPLNSTSFFCPNGLIIEVEFWHGHCSTSEVLSNRDLERMYEANLITLGNFYTGHIDRLNITCAVRQSITSDTKRLHISDLIILCLLGIMVCLLCIVGCYYGRGWGSQ